jgi:hypothetical protein
MRIKTLRTIAIGESLVIHYDGYDYNIIDFQAVDHPRWHGILPDSPWGGVVIRVINNQYVKVGRYYI